MDYEELEQKFQELEEEKKQLEEKSEEQAQELEKIKSELSGEKDKDKNFTNLRSKKEKIEDEKNELEDRFKELNEQIDSMKKEKVDSIKDDYYNKYVGDDEEDRKRVESEFELLSEDLPVKERIEKAIKLSEIKPDNGDTTFFNGVGVDGVNEMPKKEGNFLETEKGKNMAESLGIDLNNKKEGDK